MKPEVCHFRYDRLLIAVCIRGCFGGKDDLVASSPIFDSILSSHL